MDKAHTLSNHQTYISRSIKLAHLHHSLSLKWDEKHSRVLLGSPTENKNITQKGIIIRICVIIFMGIGIIFSKKQSIFEVVILVYELVMLNACLTQMQAFNKHASEINQYINGHLSFPKPRSCLNVQMRRFSFITLSGLLFAYSLFPLFVFLGLGCAYGLHLFNPCKTTLLGYWLLPECYNGHFNPFVNFVTKVIVFVTNHLIWSYTLSGIMIEIGVVILLGSMSFSDNLRR